MSLFWIALTVCILFLLAYQIYGRYLSSHFQLNPKTQTPACEINDGNDYVPTKVGFLLGQHFSAISAAGPIVGPILAGLWFGWLPVLLWIVGGAIFFGAVHDFSSLVSSVRHRAVSIAELVKEYIGKRGYLLFMSFVWLSLMYVITAFTDLTSGSFVQPELGGAVATSSILYLLIGITMGIALKIFKSPLGIATAIFLPMVCCAVWFGQLFPITISGFAGLAPQQIWNLILLLYCLLASIAPVWILLQPRGYLGGFFLYVTLFAGVIGLFLGGERAQYPAFIGFVNEKGMPLFPILFVTVACGACSGFHGIVSSGTTSKQIEKEPDCRLVGYGAMLLEGLVALIALSTVMVLARGDLLTNASPDRIYAEGLSHFMEHLGIPANFSKAFVLLAFTTFIYDTLDVATRLARYILEELWNLSKKSARFLATAASLVIPLMCVSIRIQDAQGNVMPAWKVFWTLFGTSNQLLAALTLMIVTVWLHKSKGPWWVSGIPAVFMLAMTIWSLGMMVYPFNQSAISIVALLLLGLSSLLLKETLQVIIKRSIRRLK